MALVDWYVQVKQAHVALVGLSATLFAARGAGVLAGRRWAMAPLARRTSVAIDTALFAAGVALWSMLRLHPLRDAWLGAKLGWLVLYIALGSMALKRAPTPAARAAFFVAALAALGTLVSVPLTRHPLGWIAVLMARTGG
ncbi:MAG: SirB2 family protein [Burkholderiales bacterium]|nr:SirB2 family protein [Burkholderiales bacterium]